MDENEQNKKWQGGLITYVNNRISSETKLIAKDKRYLIVSVGKLVLINVYLPHQNFHDKELYDKLLHEITQFIEELDESHCYIIAGDFNATGRNLKSFIKFRRELKLLDWSDNIPYTYAQMCKSGTASSKLDFVLAKNMQDNALQSCEIDEEFVAKGGHVILRTTAKMPC